MKSVSQLICIHFDLNVVLSLQISCPVSKVIVILNLDEDVVGIHVFRRSATQCDR